MNDLEIYRKAMKLGEDVWSLVLPWDIFGKDTVGKQFVRAADSVAANIAEGYGRYHFKENQKFCYYSRGSLEESQTWLEKAVRRGLIEREEGKLLYDRMETLKRRLNAYIRSIGPVSGSESDDR